METGLKRHKDKRRLLYNSMHFRTNKTEEIKAREAKLCLRNLVDFFANCWIMYETGLLVGLKLSEKHLTISTFFYLYLLGTNRSLKRKG